MKNLQRNFFLAILIFTSTQIFGQQNVIQTAAFFLAITPDSRAGAMGETGVATSPDVNSMHWNVAKLAFAEKKFGAGISYTPWLRTLVPDMDLAYLSLYAKPDSVSAVTASLRYFSLGNVAFISSGGTLSQSRPNEFAIDLGYSRRIAKYWSLGMAGRYIQSNLMNGLTINNQLYYAGKVSAIDLGAYYSGPGRTKIFHHSCIMRAGLAITNIGSKMKYTKGDAGEFIPINLRLGQGFSFDLSTKHSFSFNYEANKLLVPTPPVYELDSNGYPVINSSGQLIIIDGKDPNVSVPEGIIQSFSDAPGGAKEEFAEISFGFGAEYCYNKIFFARAGYFYESPTKGVKQFVTLGGGVKFNFVSLDLSYLIPTNGQRNPLEKTLRFSLLFEFNKFKAKK
jgi:hypothetical protein